MPENFERRFQPEPPDDDTGKEPQPTPESSGGDKEESSAVLDGLLEMYEDGLEKKYLTSADSADEISERIQKAREAGTDLASIPNLDERLERLNREAPLVTVQHCLDVAQEYNTYDPQKMIGSANWYWAARAALQDHGDKIPEDKKAQFQEQLSKIAADIGVDESIPIEPRTSREEKDRQIKQMTDYTFSRFEWGDWEEVEDETYEAKSEQFEVMREQAQLGLESARQKFDYLHQRYDDMFASARENFVRLPKNSDLTEKLVSELHQLDTDQAKTFEMMQQLYQESQEKMNQLFENAQPEFMTMDEIKDLHTQVGQMFEMIRNQEENLDYKLDKLQGGLSNIPLLKR
jgi:hypothetical protein